MTQQTLPPPPNTLLLPEADRDAVWRGWFNQLFVRASEADQIVHNDLNGLQGGTTDQYYHLTAAQHSTVTSFGSFTNNRVLVTGPTSSITTTADLAYSIATSTLTAINISTRGTLTIGDAEADTLIYNSGTWTLNNRFTATRAVGTHESGTQSALMSWFVTGAGAADGTSRPIANEFRLDLSGANAFPSAAGSFYRLRHIGSATLTTGRSLDIELAATNTGNITNARAVEIRLLSQASNTIAAGSAIFVESPTISGGGAITNISGLQIDNQGNSGISTATGVRVVDFTNSLVMRGIHSSLSSGTGKHNLYIDGTADNVFAGNVRIGSTVAPTVALDVTGTAIISGGLSVATKSVVSSYSAAIGDFTILGNASGTALTITIPHASTFPQKIYNLKKTDSSGNVVTVSSVSNIDGATVTTLPAQFDFINIQSDATQWWVIGT